MIKNEYLRKKYQITTVKITCKSLVYSQFLAMGSIKKQELNFSDVSSIPVDVMSIMAEQFVVGYALIATCALTFFESSKRTNQMEILFLKMNMGPYF